MHNTQQDETEQECHPCLWERISVLLQISCNEDQIVPFYMRFLFHSKILKESLKKEVKTSAGNYNLNIPSIKKLKIPLPNLDEQHKILVKLKSIEKQINCLEKERYVLQQLKKGLMQNLLSGTVRVKV
ncbi:Type I restriction modification system, specificity protein [Candidatus Magnetomorum sp. HK-1]|nr:Type I restriction modification system, specificity protein [Candidatus Magnetomorum sp. HK-1]